MSTTSSEVQDFLRTLRPAAESTGAQPIVRRPGEMLRSDSAIGAGRADNLPNITPSGTSPTPQSPAGRLLDAAVPVRPAAHAGYDMARDLDQGNYAGAAGRAAAGVAMALPAASVERLLGPIGRRLLSAGGEAAPAVVEAAAPAAVKAPQQMSAEQLQAWRNIQTSLSAKNKTAAVSRNAGQLFEPHYGGGADPFTRPGVEDMEIRAPGAVRTGLDARMPAMADSAAVNASLTALKRRMASGEVKAPTGPMRDPIESYSKLLDMGDKTPGLTTIHRTMSKQDAAQRASLIRHHLSVLDESPELDMLSPTRREALQRHLNDLDWRQTLTAAADRR